MVKRRTVLKTAGASTGLAALAGCLSVDENTDTEQSGGGQTDNSGSSDDTATATPEPGEALLWHSRTEADISALETDIETFQNQTVHSVKPAKIADFVSKSNSAIPAGDGPQLFEWAHDLGVDYWERGFLTDQSDNVDIDLESTFSAAAASAAKWDDNLIGLPFAAETVSLIYNKDMVDEPPETFAEMKAIMEEHHDPDNNQFGLGYNIDPYFISAFPHTFGGFYYDDEQDELGLTRSDTLRGFRTVIEDLWPYSPNDPGYDPQAAVFVDGNAPLTVNGPWFMGSLEDTDIDAGVTTLPPIDGNHPKPYTGVQLIYFAKKMQDGIGVNADAARRYAEWYTTNEDVLLTNAKDSGFIPVHQDVAASDELGEVTSAFASSVANGRPMPASPKMQKVWGPTGDAFMKALNGSQDLKPAMSQAESTIRENWES
jgi:arabinogalactan oligomer/maltooligosaccharide transport system substrate-binding protein